MGAMQAATNFALTIGASATNNGTSVMQTATNFALTLGGNDTNYAGSLFTTLTNNVLTAAGFAQTNALVGNFTGNFTNTRGYILNVLFTNQAVATSQLYTAANVKPVQLMNRGSNSFVVLPPKWYFVQAATCGGIWY